MQVLCVAQSHRPHKRLLLHLLKPQGKVLCYDDWEHWPCESPDCSSWHKESPLFRAWCHVREAVGSPWCPRREWCTAQAVHCPGCPTSRWHFREAAVSDTDHRNTFGLWMCIALSLYWQAMGWQCQCSGKYFLTLASCSSPFVFFPLFSFYSEGICTYVLISFTEVEFSFFF